MNRKEYKVNTRKEGRRKESERDGHTFKSKFLRINITKDEYNHCGEKYKTLLKEITDLQ